VQLYSWKLPSFGRVATLGNLCGVSNLRLVGCLVWPRAQVKEDLRKYSRRSVLGTERESDIDDDDDAAPSGAT